MFRLLIFPQILRNNIIPFLQFILQIKKKQVKIKIFKKISIIKRIFYLLNFKKLKFN